jgi:hypothetical protein
MIEVSIPGRGWEFFFHHRVQTSYEAHPTSYPMGTRGFSLGVKRLGRETDHSPPSSAEVENAWSYTSAPQYAAIARCSVKKHGGNFTVTFTFTVAPLYQNYILNLQTLNSVVTFMCLTGYHTPYQPICY